MSAAERVQKKVKEVANEDLAHAQELAKDAFRSAAYLYPFKVCRCSAYIAKDDLY
jgi:hypothetical protein